MNDDTQASSDDVTSMLADSKLECSDKNRLVIQFQSFICRF